MSKKITVKFICDRCGKEIKPDIRLAKIKIQNTERKLSTFEKFKLRWQLGMEDMGETEVELCGDCSYVLFEWWHKLGEFKVKP